MCIQLNSRREAFLILILFFIIENNHNLQQEINKSVLTELPNPYNANAVSLYENRLQLPSCLLFNKDVATRIIPLSSIHKH